MYVFMKYICCGYSMVNDSLWAPHQPTRGVDKGVGMPYHWGKEDGHYLADYTQQYETSFICQYRL